MQVMGSAGTGVNIYSFYIAQYDYLIRTLESFVPVLYRMCRPFRITLKLNFNSYLTKHIYTKFIQIYHISHLRGAYKTKNMTEISVMIFWYINVILLMTINVIYFFDIYTVSIIILVCMFSNVFDMMYLLRFGNVYVYT